jgi:pimeloyl-ACP methyl ester carboxylesterase
MPPHPTLYMHGRDDCCVAAEYASSVLGFLARYSEADVVEDAAQWLHLEKPQEVNRRIVGFVGAGAR